MNGTVTGRDRWQVGEVIMPQTPPALIHREAFLKPDPARQKRIEPNAADA